MFIKDENTRDYANFWEVKLESLCTVLIQSISVFLGSACPSTHYRPKSAMLFTKSNMGDSSVNLKKAETPAGAGRVPFYPHTEIIFWNVFDFFGTLDSEGQVITLDGSIFEQTKTNPKFLVGQRLSETVFWQSSEHTSRTVDDAINRAADGESSRTIVDFRINSDRKVVVELFLQPLKQEDEAEYIFFPASR